jgi:arylsulfatase A-like enzyme
MKFILIFFSLFSIAVAQPYNVLFVMLDDWGADNAWTNTHPDAIIPPTPNMQRVAQQGMTLTGCRSMPLCTPSRVALMTGRYPFKTGSYNNTAGTIGGDDANEYTYAEDLHENYGYQNALIGKWGITGTITDPTIKGGFNFYQGTLSISPSYFSRTKYTVVDATPVSVGSSTIYQTTEITNDAIAWINAQTGPWTATVWYHAPHGPLVVPPNNLHPITDTTGVDPTRTGNNPTDPTGNIRFRAMVEAVDTEFGRLLDSIDTTNTFIIVTGDNMTANVTNPQIIGGVAGGNNVQPPWIRAKSSVYFSGNNVPFFITGPGIPAGKTSNHPFHFVDFYPSLMKLLGYTVNSPNPIDGRDMSTVFKTGIGPRNIMFFTNNRITFGVSDTRYSYIASRDALYAGIGAFYDLSKNPWENQTGEGAISEQYVTTPADLRALTRMRAALYKIIGSTPNIEKRYTLPTTTSGALKVKSGNINVSSPTLNTNTISTSVVANATVYTLWKKAGDTANWEKTNLTPVIAGGIVTFTDPEPIGLPTYLITNNAIDN